MALKDITLGQYFPGSSPIHNLDPRAKLVGLVCYIVALFLGERLVTYGILLAVLAAGVQGQRQGAAAGDEAGGVHPGVHRRAERLLYPR